MKYLINEYPIVVTPTLIKAFGASKAIFIQKLHYWLSETSAGVWHDNRKWIHNTYDEWQVNFPFWSVRNIRKIITELEQEGIVVSAVTSPNRWDRTKSYTLDYDKLSDQIQTHVAQKCHIDVAQKCQFDVAQKCHINSCNTSSNTSSNTADDDFVVSTTFVEPQKVEKLAMENMPIDWKIAGGEVITQEDLDTEQDKLMMDRAWLIAAGTGVHAPYYKEMAYAFMKTRNIIIPEDKCKGQRKPIHNMLEAGATYQHVVKATEQLMNSKTKLGKKLTVTDMHSIEKTVLSLASMPDTNDHHIIEGV